MMNRKLFIIYHLFQAPKWEQIFAEQLGLLYASGILNYAHLHLSINGDCAVPPLKHCTIIHRQNESAECESLLLAREVACAEPSSRILYMHSKGISHPTSNQDDWRMMMQYYLLINWRLALGYLGEHDVATVNWRTHPVPHPSGNFWWANASYLMRLDPNFIKGKDRTAQEFWLGSLAPKVANLYETEIDHYNYHCPPSLYCHSYFETIKKEKHKLSYSSRAEAIKRGELTPVFNVDYF